MQAPNDVHGRRNIDWTMVPLLHSSRLWLRLYFGVDITLLCVDQCFQSMGRRFMGVVWTLLRQSLASLWVLLKNPLCGVWGVFPGCFEPKKYYIQFRIITYKSRSQKTYKTYERTLEHTSTFKHYLLNVLTFLDVWPQIHFISTI